MEISLINPHHIGWSKTKLNKKSIDFIWDAVNESQKEENKHSAKGGLVGNISRSSYLVDKDNWFLDNILSYHANLHFQSSNNTFPVQFYHPSKPTSPENIGDSEDEIKYLLTSWWVNYQYKHEFNPTHYHTGLYSFVIWLKIPYNIMDEHMQPFLKGVKPIDRRAGLFAFTVRDMLGDLSSYNYEPEEGVMLFFPARLEHCVYPFYTSDEPRITIAGNIALDLNSTIPPNINF
tara:strand:- start:63 stop:761 length:699 start_codon:yes stop_codon:yes gene_type:complete